MYCSNIISNGLYSESDSQTLLPTEGEREREMAEEEEWLPLGWTVEIRVRKNGKKDRCYTDPSKEHKFNSKPEVLRYLKSIEILPESEKRRSSRNRPSLNSSALVERVHVEDSRTREQKISNRTSETAQILKDEKVLEFWTGGDTTYINGVCDSAILPEASPQNKQEVENPVNERLQTGNNHKSNNNEKLPDMTRRASKRLAGAEVSPIPELNPNLRTRRVSMRRIDDTNSATVGSSCHNTTAISLVNNKQDCIKIHNTKANSAKDNEDTLQIKTSNGKNDDVVSSSVEVPMEDFLMDPCITFAIETLTGKIPIEETWVETKNPIASTCVDLWGDPCVEFAVKTLTGDLPFEYLSFENFIKKK